MTGGTKLYIRIFWLSAFIMLMAIFPILPTFDAWTTTSAPNPYPLEWNELLPQGEYWRPWDILYAHFLGSFPELFPFLNHLFIGTVHILNSILTYTICRRLGFSDKVSFISLAYFFACPAMLGVVVDVDSIHQVAAMMWGLLSLYVYLGKRSRLLRVSLWIVFVLIGTLAKESCFAFMLITPFTAWGFKRIDGRTFWKDILWAVAAGIMYLTARFALNQGEIASEYTEINVYQLVKNGGIFFIFHLPVILVLLFNLGSLKKRSVLVFICCIFFASILHLASVYATMHTYVSLPFAAIIFAAIVSELEKQKPVILSFLILSLLIDAYLTKKTYDSGELGLRLAHQAVLKTPEPTDSVYTISVAAGPKGFSTFIVRDYNAFAWGIFSRYLNNFVWPVELKDTTLQENPTKETIDSILEKGRVEGFRTFWIVRNDSVEVVCKP